jgi:hypothetical protein
MPMKRLLLTAIGLAACVAVAGCNSEGETPPLDNGDAAAARPSGTTPALPGDKSVAERPAAPAMAKSPAVGTMAPEISSADTDGVDFNLSDYRGKVVMLDFWGNW